MTTGQEASSVPGVSNTNPMQDKLEDLRSRKDQALRAGSPRSVERQHEKGKLPRSVPTPTG
ncbi:MAG: hypothetical protein RL119_472 [Actinomycetota bacterium]